jgi:hypothetical protein
LFADRGSAAIRKIDVSTGIITTVIQGSRTGESGKFNATNGPHKVIEMYGRNVTFTSAGIVYVYDPVFDRLGSITVGNPGDVTWGLAQHPVTGHVYVTKTPSFYMLANPATLTQAVHRVDIETSTALEVQKVEYAGELVNVAFQASTWSAPYTLQLSWTSKPSSRMASQSSMTSLGPPSHF